MKLSKRLLTIAQLIEDNSKVIDIGCDHGYLDIYLTKNKKCKCIASDVNENALNSCKKNIKKYGLENKIKTVLSNGLDNIKESSDYIVLAGMGTTTIINILSDKKLSNNIIISSNNEIKRLRKFMTGIGYYISDEKFILDKNKPYVIISFKKGNKKYKNIEYSLGPICIKNIEYRKYCIEQIKNIKKKIPKKYIFRILYLNWLLIYLKKRI